MILDSEDLQHHALPFLSFVDLNHVGLFPNTGVRSVPDGAVFDSFKDRVQTWCRWETRQIPDFSALSVNVASTQK